MLQINGSIASHNNRIWCAYRTAHLHNDYNPECILSELNNDFDEISAKRLLTEDNNTAFEDVRLFSAGDKLLAIYTYFPFNENGGWTPRYSIGYGEVDTQTGLIKNQISLSKLSTRYHEKNWSPYVYNESLFMISDFDPYLRIIKIGHLEEEANPEEIYLSSQKTDEWEFGELRGGTPLISQPGTNDQFVYGFIHSFRFNDNNFQRYYYYTAVRFDIVNKSFMYYPTPLENVDDDPDDMYEALWHYSNGRRFKVVFPTGIMNYDKGVLVSFGIDDVITTTKYFSWHYINNLFKMLRLT